jgi:cytochrome c-type biogenesis protein
VGAWFADMASSGTLLLAIPIAMLAGLVSFASPCIIPLLPGYFSYITGMSAADLSSARRGRLLAGTLLFVLGFSVVFVSYGALFGSIGFKLLEYQRPLSVFLGVIIVVLGLVFMGSVPVLQRNWRINRVPAIGVGAAPLLGGIFAIGWTPCLGPTLTAVLSLAMTEGTAARGATLAFAYCLGLGAPFVASALAYQRLLGANSWIRRHQRALNIFGGVMMITVGLLLLTGLWDSLINDMRGWNSGFVTPI